MQSEGEGSLEHVVEEGDDEYGSGLETAVVVRTIVHPTNAPLICFPWRRLLDKSWRHSSQMGHIFCVKQGDPSATWMRCGGHCDVLPDPQN